MKRDPLPDWWVGRSWDERTATALGLEIMDRQDIALARAALGLVADLSADVDRLERER